jgi:hypothetical protein
MSNISNQFFTGWVAYVVQSIGVTARGRDRGHRPGKVC